MALAARVEHREALEQRALAGERLVRRDLDIIEVALGAVLVRVAAAGAAGLAVEDHAASFVRRSRGRRNNTSAPSSRTGREPASTMRSERTAASSRDSAASAKRICGAWKPNVSEGSAWTMAPPPSEASPIASPPVAANAATWNERSRGPETESGSVNAARL